MLHTFRKSVSSDIKYMVYAFLCMFLEDKVHIFNQNLRLVFDSPEKLRTNNLAGMVTVGCSGWIWTKEWQEIRKLFWKIWEGKLWQDCGVVQEFQLAPGFELS